MSEISPAQLAANRANAALSGGPKTEEGKKRSSLNATRHGLTARAVVLPREDQNEYLAFSKKIIHDLGPGNTVERELAQLIADQQWRLKRVAAMENTMMGMGGAEGGENIEILTEDMRTLATFGIYIQRIHRVMRDAQKQLTEMKAKRKAEQEQEMSREVRIYKTYKMMGLEWEPYFDGFVYSEQELKDEIYRRDMNLASFGAAKWDYSRSKYEESLKETAEAEGSKKESREAEAL